MTELSPLRISIAAPSGGGKTTLIASMLKDTEHALPEPLCVKAATEADRRRIDDFNQALESLLAKRVFSFTMNLVGGTQNIIVNNFVIECRDVSQPLSMMDIPGGWLRLEDRPADQWETFEAHLDESVALWIPVDAVPLCEAKVPEERREASLRLMPTDIRDIVEHWVKFRASEEHRNEPAVLCFVPIKCERYLSDPEAAARLFERARECYGESIEIARKWRPDCEIYYAPVETIGCVVLKKAFWNIEYKGKSLVRNLSRFFSGVPASKQGGVTELYKRRWYRRRRIIMGANTVVAPVYRYGAACIKAALAEDLGTKEAAFASRGFITKFADLFGGKQRKLNEIAGIRDSLEKLESAFEVLARNGEENRYCRRLP